MAEKINEEKLEDIIGKFLEVYKFLSPEEKIRFEIDIAKKSKTMDDKTKNLYTALIAAAKDGDTTKGAISKMQKIK